MSIPLSTSVVFCFIVLSHVPAPTLYLEGIFDPIHQISHFCKKKKILLLFCLHAQLWLIFPGIDFNLSLLRLPSCFESFDVFFLVLLVRPATADFDKEPLLFLDVQYCGEGASFQILF